MDKQLQEVKISVLISVYHKENPEYFNVSLESLFKQSFKADEIILVKDGILTPELDAVVVKWESLFRKSLKIVPLEKNIGLSEALNQGLRHCTSTWVARMDTDDICLPERLEVIAKYIESNPTADIVGSFAIRIDEDGNPGEIIRVPVDSQVIRELVWTCPMIHPTVCYRKDKILAIGGYDPAAGPRQDDYDLWFRCVAAGYEFHNIPRPLLLYRFTYDNMRRNNLRVGWYRLKVGFKGNRIVGASFKAYIVIMVPFLRALLPYPVNIWVYKFLHRFNPRNRKIT